LNRGEGDSENSGSLEARRLSAGFFLSAKKEV